jgi:hypothetical protein
MLLDQPYISRDFAPTQSSPDNPNDCSLSNLGIMLLELCFGTALEDHELRQKYPTGSTLNPFLDTLLRWSGPGVLCKRGAQNFQTQFCGACKICLEVGSRMGSWTSGGRSYF